MSLLASWQVHWVFSTFGKIPHALKMQPSYQSRMKDGPRISAIDLTQQPELLSSVILSSLVPALEEK